MLPRNTRNDAIIPNERRPLALIVIF
jgi:hypothetical protein